MTSPLVKEANEVYQRVLARIAELTPYVREYEQLREIAEQMGSEPPAGRDRPPLSVVPSPASSFSAPPSAASPQPPAVRQQRRPARPSPELTGRILAAVRAAPGSTVADISARIDVPAPRLYRPVRELTERGALVKRGRRLSLPTGI